MLAASDYNLYSSRATSDETEGAPQADGGGADRRAGPGWGAGVLGSREVVRGLPVAGRVGAGQDEAVRRGELLPLLETFQYSKVTVLIRRYSFKAASPRSLPNPDCLNPPKGAATSVLL